MHGEYICLKTVPFCFYARKTTFLITLNNENGILLFLRLLYLAWIDKPDVIVIMIDS